MSQPNDRSTFFQSDVGKAVADVLGVNSMGRTGHSLVSFAEETARQLTEWAEDHKSQLGPEEVES